MNRPPPHLHNTVFRNPLLWISLFFAALLIGAVAEPAPTGNEKKPAPNIQFAETEFKFGKVQAGEVVKHEFVFTNTGDATLEISSVVPGCGCTTAGKWDKRVEPGKTGVVPLQFNSANFGGDISKEATVSCNDPSHARVVLHLKGNVWKALDITPPMVVFNVSTENDAQQTQTMRIVNNLTNDVLVWDAQCKMDGFTMELRTNSPGKEYQLKVTANPPFKRGTIMAPITLKTSVKNMEMVNVAAYTVLQPQVQVNPSQINLPAGPLGSRMSPGVYVRSSWTNALVLSDAKVNLEGVMVQIHEIAPGKVFHVTTTFQSGFLKPAGKELELQIKSNHPQFAVIKVPIFQAQSDSPTALKTGAEATQSAAVQQRSVAQ